MGSLTAEALVRWLLAGDCRLPSGAYWSWVGDDDSAYLYPEAAAVAVRIAAWWSTQSGSPEAIEAMVPTLDSLCSAVDKQGLIGRGEGRYLFDSLLALAALETARRLQVPFSRLEEAINRLCLGCDALLGSQVAYVGPPTESRWSTRFGPHILKPLALVRTLGLPLSSSQNAFSHLASLQREDGAFVHPDEARPYLHAHCYALEGMVIADPSNPQVTRALEFLLRVEHATGGYPHWPDDSPVVAADVTAQAGRLFSIAGNVAAARRARNALVPLCTDSGALRYSSESTHENTWATAFAAQMVVALETGLLPQWLG